MSMGDCMAIPAQGMWWISAHVDCVSGYVSLPPLDPSHPHASWHQLACVGARCVCKSVRLGNMERACVFVWPLLVRRVQLKGLTASQNALAARVKSLEEIVAQQVGAGGVWRALWGCCMGGVAGRKCACRTVARSVCWWGNGGQGVILTRVLCVCAIQHNTPKLSLDAGLLPLCAPPSPQARIIQALQAGKSVAAAGAPPHDAPAWSTFDPTPSPTRAGAGTTS